MIIFFPERSALGAAEGLRLAAESAIVSLLPFAVFSSAVISSGLDRVFAAVVSKVFVRLFNVSPYGAAAFVTGLLGGYPSGVKAVCDIYDKRLITREEAEKLLAFCNNSGIVFILSAAGIGAFKSLKAGILLYSVHLLSAVVTGIVMRGSGFGSGTMSVREEWEKYKKEKPSPMSVLGKSISSSGSAMINVASSIIVFNAIISVFRLENVPLLCGLTEMTKGVFLAGDMGSLPLGALFLSWGGMSVHAQTAAITSKYDFKLKKYFLGKGISAAIAFVVTYLLTIKRL
jgi:sporulation integral membrane protein YlbJ